MNYSFFFNCSHLGNLCLGNNVKKKIDTKKKELKKSHLDKWIFEIGKRKKENIVNKKKLIQKVKYKWKRLKISINREFKKKYFNFVQNRVFNKIKSN